MPIPIVFAGGSALGSLGAKAVSWFMDAFGHYAFMGAVISIYLTLTAAFTGWFILAVGALLASMPSLPQPFLLGASLFPTSTLIACLTFLFMLRSSIWVYQLKLPFLVNMARIGFRTTAPKTANSVTSLSGYGGGK